MGLTSPDLEAFVPRARLSRARAGLQTVQGVAHTFTRSCGFLATGVYIIMNNAFFFNTPLFSIAFPHKLS